MTFSRFAITSAAAGLLGFLGYRFVVSRRNKRAHDAKVAELLTEFGKTGCTDTFLADQIRQLTYHCYNPHAAHLSYYLAFHHAFLTQHVSKLVMSTPQNRTPEAAFQRYEQTAKLLHQSLLLPPLHERSVEAIARTNFIHAKFPVIFDKYRADMVYVLAMISPFAFKDAHEKLRTRRKMGGGELQAIWVCSKQVLEMMGCKQVPEKWEDAEQFCKDFAEVNFVENKATRDLSRNLVAFFGQVNPVSVPSWACEAINYRLLPVRMKEACGLLEEPGLVTRLAALLIFDTIFPLVDLMIDTFFFPTVPFMNFDTDIDSDGKVPRASLLWMPFPTVEKREIGERFRIGEVNAKYEAGARLEF